MVTFTPKATRRLDTHQLIETPEGIDISLFAAGPIARVLAYAIDLLIRAIAQGIFAAILAFMGTMGFGIMSVMFFLIEWFYAVYFEVFHNGQTPGKKFMNLQVIHDDGTPITWNASVLRNLLRTADFLPVLYLTGIISMVLSKDFKRLGDHAAGTLVIYKRSKPAFPQLKTASPAAFPLSLSLEEQRAILSFAEREADFSEERKAELANILADITGKRNNEAVNHLYKIANGLIRSKL